jgi:hypothetical protein
MIITGTYSTVGAVETQNSLEARRMGTGHSRTIHHSNTDSLDENAGDHFTRLCPILTCSS